MHVDRFRDEAAGGNVGLAPSLRGDKLTFAQVMVGLEIHHDETVLATHGHRCLGRVRQRVLT
jgi:hypothetical protein